MASGALGQEQVPASPVGEGSLSHLYPSSLTAVQAPPAGGDAAAQPADTGAGGDSQDDLASKFTSPTALLTSYQFVSWYNPIVAGAKGDGYQFLFRPVIPIPKNDIIPLPQIVRITAPVASAVDVNSWTTIPGGFGDVQLFDLFVMPLSKTVTVGLGPVAIFPTATSRFSGQGRYQLGPAGVFLYTGIEKWQLGFLGQELFSLGSNDRDSVHQMIYQVIATRHFEKGWYLGLCGQPATIDWLSGHAQFPAGVGIGRVFTIGKQPVNFSVTPTYFVGATELQSRLQIQFNFALIYGK